MDPKLSRVLRMRPSKSGTQTSGVEMLPPLRGHDHYVTSVAFSHDGANVVSGSWGRPFESGMQTPGSGCSRIREATIVMLHLLHSRTMDQKLSRGLTTRSFKSGMQTRRRDASTLCESAMDPRLSRGVRQRPLVWDLAHPNVRC